MPLKNKVTLSTAPSKHSLSSAERRAAEFAEVANKQADLKREAAERRALRARTA
jgi:hypothetical protein